jgi:heme/copper-type cytochrome/quinol oxidase subunit 3
MVMALASIQRGLVGGLLKWLAVASGLGAMFISIKAFEYKHKIEAGIRLSENLFGSFYFTLTGLHLLHLVGGLLFNGYIAWRALEGRYSAGHHERVEYAGLYWHFVDLVWIVLFPLLYLV